MHILLGAGSVGETKHSETRKRLDKEKIRKTLVERGLKE